ncbi:MAG: glutamine--tRNA ligase/YqeY domain fusion protein [Bacteroidales bacterium]|nr:glutamine--tRNA ligase/YqeY domain fusion protein [Bacteroidales bacterium]
MTEQTNIHPDQEHKSLNFIEQFIEEDIKTGKHGGRVHTRFPPEPNGYLHIGHAKAFCLDFGLAEKYNGKCNLRFDDTNPVAEDTSYVDAIKKDIRWMGFDWEDREYYTSDYFDQLYDLAVKLIKKGKAYVCDLSAGEIGANRGTPTQPGVESPYRNRTVEENLDLFKRMKNGEFPDDSKTLRAKIDMASPNMHMRDPILYRIRHVSHHRTGNKWCIYPMYDWAHGQSDSIEEITHSLCTLEFEVHRPLYEWFIRELEIFPSRQIEFARLNLSYTIMSKRKLLQLVNEKHVSGWDDPRMPTIHGLRRRGYTPESIRTFAEMVGIAKRENVIDVALLEYCIREDLNKKAARVMAVLDPVKLIIDNYPDDQEEQLKTINNPEDESMGSRILPFCKELYIERDDFKEDPPKKFFRLSPGREVRLKSAYIIKGESVEKDTDGHIIAIHCTYDPDSKSGSGQVHRKVKGTLHWVSARHALNAEVRLYDRLFNDPDPDGHKDHDFKEFINPDSLKILANCKVEPSLQQSKPLDHLQFIRLGYFNVDPDSTPEHLVFNRTVPLRDTWGKKNKV